MTLGTFSNCSKSSTSGTDGKLNVSQIFVVKASIVQKAVQNVYKRPLQHSGSLGQPHLPTPTRQSVLASSTSFIAAALALATFFPSRLAQITYSLTAEYYRCISSFPVAHQKSTNWQYIPHMSAPPDISTPRFLLLSLLR